MFSLLRVLVTAIKSSTHQKRPLFAVIILYFRLIQHALLIIATEHMRLKTDIFYWKIQSNEDFGEKNCLAMKYSEPSRTQKEIHSSFNVKNISTKDINSQRLTSENCITKLRSHIVQFLIATFILMYSMVWNILSPSTNTFECWPQSTKSRFQGNPFRKLKLTTLTRVNH